MAERDIEAYLRDEVKKIGGKAYKWVSPGSASVPDRIILVPKSIIIFVEVKDVGKKATKLQSLCHAKLQKIGFEVLTINSKQGVLELIKKIIADERFDKFGQIKGFNGPGV